ncbi:MAG: TrkH family potassium uptake protein [Desulfatiglandales bacterium]|jgi:trk system potassium uptake protein
MTLHNRILKAHPATLVLASFLLAITFGTVLLMLPISTHSRQISFINALFTATSAVCVTGLIVEATGTFFTGFGQSVILALIQIGGLGVMTFSVALFRLIGRNISFRQRLAMQDLFSHTPREDIFNLIRSTILFTLCAEIIGALLLYVHWSKELSFSAALYTSVFHSISAFCNAGFSLFSDSMMRYSDSVLLNATMCSLIVLGGIGFPVLYDLQSWVRSRRKQRARLTVQTKTVLLTTLLLIAGGALMFALLEYRSIPAPTLLTHHFLVSVFQSVTCRTAGFNTVDIASLSEATLALMIFLMFFGASPGSCGGGVKTTTLALIGAFTLSRVRGHHRVNMFRKSIPSEAVNRSISLLLVSIGVIGLVLFMILVGEAPAGSREASQGGSFLAYLFETASAFGTVGLSMGVTSGLSTWSKSWIILMMIAGRVGVLTFSYIIVGRGVTNGIEYSEESLMIG